LRESCIRHEAAFAAKPLKTDCGMLATYGTARHGTAPMAEGIDANRRELLSGFGESVR
jgi:hypothetical protein